MREPFQRDCVETHICCTEILARHVTQYASTHFLKVLWLLRRFVREFIPLFSFDGSIGLLQPHHVLLLRLIRLRIQLFFESQRDVLSNSFSFY